MTPSRRLTASLAIALLAACGAKADKASADPPKAAAGGAKAQPAAPSPLPPTAGTKLASYVGKYPFDTVDGVAWNDHMLVKAGIAASVKDAAVLKAITTTEGPSGPIEMRGGKVMAWACEAHNCGSHQWSVHIDPRTGATDVCYYDEAADPAKARWFLAAGKEEKREGNCQ